MTKKPAHEPGSPGYVAEVRKAILRLEREGRRGRRFTTPQIVQAHCVILAQICRQHDVDPQRIANAVLAEYAALGPKGSTDD